MIPYFGYALQDRKSSPGAHLGESRANILHAVGVKRVLTSNCTRADSGGIFDVPVVISSPPLLWGLTQKLNISDAVNVSPDTGGAERARFWARG